MSQSQIRFHLVDGQSLLFSVEESVFTEKILTQIHPERVFGQNAITLAGFSSIFAIPCARISMVELETSISPKWQLPPDVTDIRETTEEKFREGYNAFRENLQQRKVTPVVGDAYVSYGELHLAGGRKLHVEVHGVIRNVIEQRRVVNQILSSSCLVSKRLAGGALLVNPQNINCVEFSPGPQELPTTAWPAEKVDAWRNK